MTIEDLEREVARVQSELLVTEEELQVIETWASVGGSRLNRLISTIRSQRERLNEVEKALRPYAAERLSTEPEFSDLVLRSPSEEMRRHAEAIETRDRNIMAARTALQGEGK